VSIFDEIKESAEGRELSTKWYRSQITALGGNTMTAEQHIEEGKVTGRPNFGMMNLFEYRPQTAQRLPFYDLFPLAIPVDTFRGGFVGINFHYLTIPMRVRLLELLIQSFSDQRMEKINVSWGQISGSSRVKPIVRRYKAKNVRSKFLKISIEDMLIAALLPVQRFYTGPLDSKRPVSSNTVYSQIRKQM